MAFQNGQLFGGNGVRPAGLHRQLRAVGEVKGLLQRGQHRVQLSGGQRGGRTAAHVKRPGTEAVFPHHFPADAQLSQKGLHIGLHQSEAPLHALTDKGAVGAAGGAERNPNIQINIPRRQTLPGLIAHNAGLQR